MMTRNLFYVAAASLILGLALMFGPARPALAHGGFAVKAYTPYKSGKSVVSTGRMYVYGWHAAARVEVVAKRKVCGFWGCSFETKATKSK
ncbi:MAG TPA: hypothetical protein VF611_17765, partial [Pyrinomonadaceae bacterium]